MKKSIYKITNNINGKCYIGQSNNIQRRFQEHRSMKNNSDGTSKLLHAAILKYGIDNFSFDILEENIENYDEREKYWIEFYHSLASQNGYNIAEGGNAPPVLRGDNNPNTTHTNEQVQLVINLLKDTKLSTKEIAKKTGYDISSIERINTGIMWRNDNINYPIREESTKEFNLNQAHNRALDIIYDLRYTKLTQKEIAIKYGVGRSTVTMINNGQNNHQPNINYPIRSKKQNKQSKAVLMIDPITGEILKEYINAAEAAKELHCSRSAIQLCCTGNTKTSQGYCWKYKDE